MTSPFPPSGNEGYIRNRDVPYQLVTLDVTSEDRRIGIPTKRPRILPLPVSRGGKRTGKIVTIDCAVHKIVIQLINLNCTIFEVHEMCFKVLRYLSHMNVFITILTLLCLHEWDCNVQY